MEANYSQICVAEPHSDKGPMFFSATRSETEQITRRLRWIMESVNLRKSICFFNNQKTRMEKAIHWLLRPERKSCLEVQGEEEINVTEEYKTERKNDVK